MNPKLIILSLMTFSSAAALAAPYTLEDAKFQARGNARLVELATAQVDEAMGNLDAAKGLRLPTLSASIGTQRASVIGGGSGIYTDHTIGLTVPFLNNQINTQIKSSKNLELSREQLLAAQINMSLLAVTTDYYNVIKTNKDIAVAKEILDISQKYYNTEATKVKAGVGNNLDSLTAKVQFNKAQTQYKDAQTQADLSCMQLLQLLADDNRTICQSLVDPVVPNSVQVDRDAAKSLGLSQRPEVQADKDIIAANQNLADGIGGFRNHISGSAGVSTGTPGNVPGSPNTFGSGLDPFHRGDTTAVGGTLTFTWGGTDRGEKRAANARTRQSQISLDAQNDQIKADVDTAAALIDQAYADKLTKQDTYDAAKAVVNAYTAQAKAGVNVLDSTTYIIDVTNLRDAERDLYEADCNIAQAVAALQEAVGASPLLPQPQFLANSGVAKPYNYRK